MAFSKTEKMVLRNTFLFHFMSPEKYQELTCDMDLDVSHVMVAAGEVFVLPSEPEHVIAVTLSGRMHTLADDGATMISIQSGFVIGVLDLFSSDPIRLPEIRSDTDTSLLIIPASQMRKIFERFPEIMMRYIYFLTGQIHTLKWENSLASTSSNEARVLQYLAANQQKHGDIFCVHLTCSYSAFATRLHMSRATLYRVLDHMEEIKVIQREGRNILILKQELLPTREYI